MTAFLANNRWQAIITAALVVAFAAFGLYLGAPPEISALTFGDVLLEFFRQDQTRTILAAIIADVITGVIAALRVGTFDGQRLAGFLRTNVIPYVFGYMLFWFLSFYGLIDVLPAAAVTGIASLGFSAVMATLAMSIADNLARARAGTTPPEGAPVYMMTPPDPQG